MFFYLFFHKFLLTIIFLEIAKEVLPQQEYTENEIEDELAGIRVQLAFIYQITDRQTQASELYESVLKKK